VATKGALAGVVVGLVSVVAGPAMAAPEPGQTQNAAPEYRRSDEVPRQGAVWFTHRGSFRFRSELLLGGDLGNGSSPVPEPLGASTGVDEDASTLTWASVRLRYEPSIHVGPAISVHLGLDALDNVIMGSTHEGAGGDLSLGLLGDSQASPSSGRNGWRDALAVRQAFARWFAIDTIELKAGRMVDHFGLGILRNGGLCEDCDFGTVVDRVSLGLGISGFQIEAAWEFTAVGVTSDLAFESERQAGGQAKDLGLSDDVTTYMLKAGQYPVSLAEKAARAVLLDEERGWAVDWAVFALFTDQDRSSLEPTVDNSVECGASETLGNGMPVSSYACTRLVRRDAFFLRPGLWLRAEKRPSMFETIRFEIEASALLGSIAHPQRLFEDDAQEAKDFSGFGMAAELEWKRDATTYGLDFGFATGDDGPYVGVLDGNNAVDPDDDGYANNDAIRNNRTITSFHFNRDYRLDLILFRQILGAVTNAVYFKPYISHELLRTETSTIYARLDALYAMAMRPSGTPGGGDHWGLEFDGRFGIDTVSGFTASLALGVLLPLDALNDPLTGDSPDPAFAMRGLFGWRF
jgi:uncharacterized protein (TIGR04551 family)